MIVAALRSRSGASSALLRRVARGEIVPLATSSLFLEYESVLKRAEHRLVHGLSIARIDLFLAALASACAPVDVHLRWRPQLSDPNDEMVLEAAANGRADPIVTFNTKDFAPAARRFGIAVRRPAKLLKESDR